MVLTVTTIVCGAAGQPPVLPLTVYVVVVAGLTLMLEVVAAVLHE